MAGLAKGPLRVRRWRHQWKSESGSANLSLARHRGGWLLRVPDLADFLIADDCRTLRVRAIAALDPDTLEHLLLEQVLPRVLAQQGGLMLHAGGVAIDGRVALFIGESGRGKSTWSAVLQRQGHPVLSDDCVLVRDRGRSIRAVPTYPGLRLLPDMVERLYPNSPNLGRLAGYSDKRRLPVHHAAMPPEGLEVAAIYLLEGPAPEQANSTIETLSPSRSCIELTRNTFKLDPTDLRRNTELLARTATVAQRVPAFSLHYPRNVAALPAFAGRVAAHVGQQPRPGMNASPARAQCAPGRQEDSHEINR